MLSGPYEGRNIRLLPERRKVRRFRQLRLVTRGRNEAEKTEWLVIGGTELMPREARHLDEVVFPDLGDRLSHQAASAAAQDQHVMEMLMPLERRMSAG